MATLNDEQKNLIVTLGGLETFKGQLETKIENSYIKKEEFELFKFLPSLPAAADGMPNVIYFIPNPDNSNEFIEYVYVPADTDVEWPNESSFEEIGRVQTTVDLTGYYTSAQIDNILAGYKKTQTAVSSPTASGNATAFIDTISQNAAGKITVTKKNIDLSSYAKKSDLTGALTPSSLSTGEISAGSISVGYTGADYIILDDGGNITADSSVRTPLLKSTSTKSEIRLLDSTSNGDEVDGGSIELVAKDVTYGTISTILRIDGATKLATINDAAIITTSNLATATDIDALFS